MYYRKSMILLFPKLYALDLFDAQLAWLELHSKKTIIEL
ncbi:hypothetical protein LHK_00813 [Laribacter hongkongensis HLHK9]|uniref:Uncharacterized protein n=1 Tax=Laribacter hongkongensis (strain HLHK9) TaxID=557598 RepID=C1D4L2_LARHH|nr:hypothetical protein LHK_00813 [Laribacter hongkongensis HLHK9]